MASMAQNLTSFLFLELKLCQSSMLTSSLAMVRRRITGESQKTISGMGHTNLTGASFASAGCPLCPVDRRPQCCHMSY